MIVMKRIYESKNENDGFRILVDRVWPRGITKEVANLDEWLKEIAPSPELRKWFCHDPNKFAEFKPRYEAELEDKPEIIAKLVKIAKGGTLVLLYGAKDKEHNQAIVLKEYLDKKLSEM